MYTALSTRTPIAKKEHKCELCLKPIIIGSKYCKEALIFEGEFQLIKFHKLCRELCDEYRNEYLNEDSYYFQDVYEWAMDEGKLKCL